MDRKLNVGILLDSFQVPAWIYRLIEKIVSMREVEITQVVVNRETSPTHQDSASSKSINRRRFQMYPAYQWLEEILFSVKPDAFEIRDAKRLLSAVPHIHVKSVPWESVRHFSEEDIRAIKAYRPDVLIRLGFRDLKGEILKVPRFGVWSFPHSDSDLDGKTPAGFWEVMKRNPVTISRLRILSEKPDSGTVLYESVASTDSLSVKRNRNYLYWKSLSFIPRKLEELHRKGKTVLRPKSGKNKRNLPIPLMRTHSIPGSWTSFFCIMKLIGRYIQYRFNLNFFKDQWILLYENRRSFPTSPKPFKRIIPPKDRFWADPFIVVKNGSRHIFMEEYDYNKGKGHLSVMTMDESGECSAPQKILERPYHLSYPFVFGHGGKLYLIPESMANRTIEMYQCVEFPNKWKFVGNLMENISAADTTLLHHRNKWWMFTTLVENSGGPPWDELFIFHSKNLLTGNWTPHPENPVVSDARKARSAGRIFERNGSLFRPSQDCTKRYGYGVVFNQILALNEKSYIEKETDKFIPDGIYRLKAIHSFDHQNQLTLMDGLTRRFRF